MRPLPPSSALGLIGLLSLAGCTLGPDFQRPAAPEDGGYTRGAPVGSTEVANGQAQRFVIGGALTPDWWRLFRSPSLDAAVRQAVAGSPDLQAAQASLRQSQDSLRAGHGVFYPQVSAGASASRLRTAPVEQGSALSGSVFNLLTLSGMISYTLDVFGGERRAVEGLQAEVDYQRYAGQAAYLALTSNVANTSIARAAYQAQIRATEQLIRLQEQQLQTTRAQASAGTAAYSSVLGIQALLASNRAQLAPLREKVEQAGNLLASLQGVVPSQALLPDIDLETLALPENLPVSLPSTLVRQRPDILSAEALLHVASADIGVATAALFPSFTLNGSYGVAGPDLGSLSSASGRFWSIGPALSAPLFSGGRLWFERQAAIDAYQQAQARYRQTVLDAFAQVADVLKALEFDAQALQAQAEARATSGEALRLVQVNYRAGLVTYLDVLAADIQFHDASIAYLQALAQRQQDTVALFAALGGGWDAEPAMPAGSAAP